MKRGPVYTLLKMLIFLDGPLIICLICREELEHFSKTEALTKLVVCFSRDPQPPEGAPRYVQDSMHLHQDALAELICDKLAVVYVCGDAKNMAKSVTQTFVEILTQHKGTSLFDVKFN